MNQQPPKQNRREHLVAWLRYTTLGAIASAGGWTILKRQRLLRRGVCINDGLCRGCPALAQCDLPEAAPAKELIEREDHDRTK